MEKKPRGNLCYEDINIEDIEATTLDCLCEDYKLVNVQFVKMDIEGAEWMALQGANRLLSGEFGTPPIVALEFSRIVPVIRGTPEDIFKYFQSRNWKIYIQEHGKSIGGLLQLVRSIYNMPEHDNIICIPPNHNLPDNMFL